MAGSSRERLDVLLVSRNLAESREQAKRLILAGKVRVKNVSNPKPGQMVPLDVDVQVEQPERYVSRGGLKLEAALGAFAVDPAGLVCADIGASTGGFTDCLLQHGAARVYAVDVGVSQMHERIRNSPRVMLVEHANARALEATHLLEPPDLFVVDVSFISLMKILPSLAARAHVRSRCIALVKPQFEASRVEVSRGKGVIRDPQVHRQILNNLVQEIPVSGWSPRNLINSPIAGGSGNREFLMLLHRLPEHNADSEPSDIDIDAVLQAPPKP